MVFYAITIFSWFRGGERGLWVVTADIFWMVSADTFSQTVDADNFSWIVAAVACR